MEFFSKKFFYLRTPLRDFVALFCYAKKTADFIPFWHTICCYQFWRTLNA